VYCSLGSVSVPEKTWKKQNLRNVASDHSFDPARALTPGTSDANMFAVLRKHAILVAVVMLFASGATASDASPKVTDKVRARPSPRRSVNTPRSRRRTERTND
jgi:hypothetical protein|tara:strand:- start:717 stop:1025 length:309 start_codon:yes stop_codon:yes gene_type:complete